LRSSAFKIWLSIGTVATLYLLFQLFTEGNYKPHANQDLQYHIDQLDRVSFAGEPIPFDEPKKKRMLNRELNKIARHSTEMAILLKNAETWFPLIEPILKKKGIPEDFKYIAVVESNLTMNPVSRQGAVGFWQIIRGTATEFGLHINDEIDERYNPIKSTYAVCKFFNQTHTYFGSWTNAAASYNMGMAALIKACKRHKSNDYHDLKLNRESSKYIYKILAFKEIIEHPEKYGLKKHPRTTRPKLIPIYVNKDIKDIVSWAKKKKIPLSVLKKFNPWIRANSLTISDKHKQYVILIPKYMPQVPKKTEPSKIENTDSSLVTK
jgi:membrane-bound lytic murein transglycosylase D